MTKTFEFKSNSKFNVSVNDNNVTIEIKGFTNFLNKGGSKGAKSIPIKAITAIQYKKPSFTTGYVQFAYSGSQETKGGTFSAVKDENTITFTQKEQTLAEEMIELIEEKRANAHSSNQASIQAISAADEILKFKQLLDEGILTQDEFDTKKKQLLGI